VVGRTIAGKLREVGHDVLIGSRSAGDDAVPFAEAAAHGELVFNCTNGAASIRALQAAGAENLSGKVLVDVSNPLSGNQEAPLFLSNDDSLGEQIQRAFPETKVVKSLHTVNASVMVDPGRLSEEQDVFVAGNDPEAKSQVAELLQSFGWAASHILDLGDISAARGTEMYLTLWLRLWGVVGSADFNIRVVR
jgi:hypothetical protein